MEDGKDTFPLSFDEWERTPRANGYQRNLALHKGVAGHLLFRARFRAARETGKPGRPEGGRGGVGIGQDEGSQSGMASDCHLRD